MNRVVWKYELQPGVTTIEVPEGGIVRHVAGQHDVPTVWIEVDPTAPQEEWATWSLQCFGTGHDGISPFKHQFLGTALIFGGHLVWHVYRLNS